MTGHGKPLSALGLTARFGGDARVSGIGLDSRTVARGMLFAALPGTRAHGAAFVPMALQRGAAAVLTDAGGAEVCGAAVAAAGAALVVAEDPRATLAAAAALWFAAQPATMVAVTGTNGKTSVATFTRQIWAALGRTAINIGTTGIEGAWAAPSAHTTPDSITLHRTLADAAAAGVTHAAMEASSHGLDQRRMDGVTLAAAGFTNLTQDHLDYHVTMEAYFAAKAALFDRLLPPGAAAVINIDDPKGPDLCNLAVARGHRLIRTGKSEGAHLRLLDQRYDTTGQWARFLWQGVPHQVRLALVGGFQAENVMVAAGLAIGAGEDPADVFRVLPQLSGVRGRMQLAATRRNGAAVFVDYAHTAARIKAGSSVRGLSSVT